MGRKSRRGKHNHDSEDETEDNHTEQSQTSSKTKFKDLDYAQRQQLKRDQAALKRKSKQKCFICGQTGHVRRECPGVSDDGRGMSRYKNKSDVKLEKKKYRARRYGEGVEEEDVIKVDYPDGFEAVDDSADTTTRDGDTFYYYDAGCDVTSTVEYLQHGRGKAKISQKEAMQEYGRYLNYARQSSNFGGLISKSVLKPNRPWSNPSPFSSENSSSEESSETEYKVPIYFLVGLSPDTKLSCHNSQKIEQHLIKTVEENEEIIGLWSFLNYTPEYLSKPKVDNVQTQREKLRLCCKIAAMKNIPIQIQLLPGVPPTEENESVAGTPYAKSILDFQSIIHSTIQSHPSLKVHLSSWAGRADHMMSLLQSFPTNLYIGFDGHVTFTKAKYLHECAFEVPLSKLLLETDKVIPSKVANKMGRDAFYCSGWVPFVAETVAGCKKVVSGEEVGRAAAENTMCLYPMLDNKEKGAVEEENGDVLDHHLTEEEEAGNEDSDHN